MKSPGGAIPRTPCALFKRSRKAYGRPEGEIALLAGTLGDLRNHHPEIRHGWGYCEIDFTSHDIGGLSDRDFACAEALNAALGEA